MGLDTGGNCSRNNALVCHPVHIQQAKFPERPGLKVTNNLRVIIQFFHKVIIQILDNSVKVNQDDFLELHDQYVMVYNRIPKTGSSSMLQMLRSLSVSEKLHFFCIKFLKFMEELSPQEINKFNNVEIYKQDFLSLHRHLNMGQQMTYVKRLTRRKIRHSPNPILCNNHVHYIGT